MTPEEFESALKALTGSGEIVLPSSLRWLAERQGHAATGYLPKRP